MDIQSAAPLYLMASVGLGFGATLGATVLLFQNSGSDNGLIFLLPVIMYMFVVALGTDYNILMITPGRAVDPHPDGLRDLRGHRGGRLRHGDVLHPGADRADRPGRLVAWPRRHRECRVARAYPQPNVIVGHLWAHRARAGATCRTVRLRAARRGLA